MSDNVQRQASTSMHDLLADGSVDLAVDDGRATAPAMPEHERRLLEQAQSGDGRALREIHDTYAQQVRAHLHRLLGADPDVDDLTQIVFVRAFSAIKRFRGGSSLGTWLYRITANTTHNLLRQRYRRGRLQAALHWFNQGRAAHLGGAGVDARQQAEALLQRLHPDLREVFVLYYYEGLTLHEIAEIHDKPISTIGDRLSRARKRLHAMIHGD